MPRSLSRVNLLPDQQGQVNPRSIQLALRKQRDWPSHHGLAILIKTLAKYWVKVDQEHLDDLKSLCAKVDPGIKGLTLKNRDRLRQFDDPKNVYLLLDFPTREVERALAADQGRRLDAVRVQVALAVALLLMMPVRASNLVGLHLDRHIQRTRAGNKGIVHIVIPGHEVKNGRDLEYELPGETVRLLDLYLRVFRPFPQRQRYAVR